jgi:DNA-binding GntR family transcriptional regulator
MARTRPHIPDLAAAPVADTSAELPARGAMGREAYTAIRQAVLDCTFLPGMALSEQSLSELLQVSRAPVREAFRRLVHEGLLEVVPQRGTFVARLDRARIADAIFVREVIECRAAELAAAAPLAQRRQLIEIVQRQARASARKDYGTHLATDEEFHRAILVIAGHPHAWTPLRLARTGMNRIRHLAIPTLGSNRIAIDDHRKIVDAIVAGKAKRAADLMREHIHSPLTYVDAIHAEHPEYFEDAPLQPRRSAA